MFEVILIIATIVGFILYFIPSLIAAQRKHHNTLAIFVLNLFLGWSFLGWVLSCIWACTTIQENTNNKTKIIWLIMIVLFLVNIIGDVVLYNYLKNYTGLIVSFNKLYSPIKYLQQHDTDINLSKTHLQTKFGILYAKQNGWFNYDLYDNQKLLIHNMYYDNLIYHTNLSNHDISIIMTATGGSGTQPSCTLVDLYNSNGNVQYKIYTDDDDISCGERVKFYNSDKCIFMQDFDIRSYADADDYILTKLYCLDKSEMTDYNAFKNLPYPETTEYAKSDAYYKYKFSNYTSEQILELMQSDGSQCFDFNTQQFDDSNACSGWVDQYCFMYNAIDHKDVVNNQQDAALYNACKNLVIIGNNNWLPMESTTS